MIFQLQAFTGKEGMNLNTINLCQMQIIILCYKSRPIAIDGVNHTHI